MKLLVIIEPTSTGWSAHSPDLPGVMATGATRDEVEALMAEAVAFHLDGLRAEGLCVPKSGAYTTVLEVAGG